VATSVAVRIVRFVEWHQPPIVACELVDANGKTHTFIDKVWIFADETFDETTDYPQPGHIRCEIVTQWQDGSGSELARISTRIDSLESTDGFAEFVVKADQIESGS
jgi:hypothetical protein